MALLRGLTSDLARHGEPLAQMWQVHFAKAGHLVQIPGMTKRRHAIYHEFFKLILAIVIIHKAGRPTLFGWGGWVQEAESRWFAGVSVVMLLLCNMLEIQHIYT